MINKQLKSASFQGKTKVDIPSGATEIKKSFNLQIEEIENGYLIVKDYNIKYLLHGEDRYEYYTKKWFSKKNPMKLDIPEEKPLADKLN